MGRSNSTPIMTGWLHAVPRSMINGTINIGIRKGDRLMPPVDCITRSGAAISIVAAKAIGMLIHVFTCQRSPRFEASFSPVVRAAMPHDQ